MDFYFDNEDIKIAKQVGDFLTNNPEISGEEKKSSEFLIQTLKQLGYSIKSPYGSVKYSFLASKQKKNAKKKIAFLCEYDALPEIGHACGHSYSCAISILAALTLQKIESIPFEVHLIGTPGEEFIGGKCYMAEDGCFDQYEFVAMVHLSNENKAQFEVLACNDKYITFHGKSSHASANPEEGINALNAARLYMDGMDMWRQHISKDCQFHGIVEKGGTLPNIIPDTVSLNYYFRASTVSKVWELNKIAENCAKGASIMTGTTVTIKQQYPDYTEIFWSDKMDQIVENAFSIIGKKVSVSEGAIGSSDVGNVSLKVPVFHPMLDITNNNKNISLHHQEFEKLLHSDSRENYLKDGAMLLYHIVTMLSNNEQLLNQIQKEHKAYCTKHKY